MFRLLNGFHIPVALLRVAHARAGPDSAGGHLHLHGQTLQHVAVELVDNFF